MRWNLGARAVASLSGYREAAGCDSCRNCDANNIDELHTFDRENLLGLTAS